MIPTPRWIARTTECAKTWREPRWHPQLLAAPETGSWLRNPLPGIVPAAVAMTTVVVTAATVAAVHLPAGPGA
ncbi:MAG: hypothetical protein ABW136_00845 [Steroidobacteraceae bacterium]